MSVGTGYTVLGEWSAGIDDLHSLDLHISDIDTGLAFLTLVHVFGMSCDSATLPLVYTYLEASAFSKSTLHIDVWTLCIRCLATTLVCDTALCFELLAYAV